jgi:hypothetical protein
MVCGLLLSKCGLGVQGIGTEALSNDLPVRFHSHLPIVHATLDGYLPKTRQEYGTARYLA